MQKIETTNKINVAKEFHSSQNVIEQKKNSFVNSIFVSFRAGTFGFAVVLTLIIITKFLAYSTGTKDFFILDLNDIIFASWGFIILSFSRFISFQKR